MAPLSRPTYADPRPSDRCQSCHKPFSKHKAGATHKFEPAARGRGRPKKGE